MNTYLQYLSITRHGFEAACIIISCYYSPHKKNKRRKKTQTSNGERKRDATHIILKIIYRRNYLQR